MPPFTASMDFYDFFCIFSGGYPRFFEQNGKKMGVTAPGSALFYL